MLNENIISELHKLNHTLRGTSFALAMQQGDEIKIYPREYQPCYGELRTYGPGSVPKEREKDYRPGDLHHPFPKGTPVAVAVPLRTSTSQDNEKHNKFVSWLFSKDSPWANGIDECQFTYNDAGRIIGVVQVDTDFDPTVFVNLLKSFRNYVNIADKWTNHIEVHGLEPWQALIASGYGVGYGKNIPTLETEGNLLTTGFGCNYGKIEFDRFKNKNPYDRSGGLTFKQRSAYNRPEVEYIFSVKENASISLPKLKTFKDCIEFVKSL